MSIATAISKANQILDENYVLEPPVDVYEIARNSGIKIIEQEFPTQIEQVSGFINIENDEPVMYVNASEPENRRKFTVAHELGHWVMHEKQIREDPTKAILLRMALGTKNQDQLEIDANAFAAELLVPMSFFEMVGKSKSQSDLAKIFRVSSEVIGYRKKALAIAEKEA